MSESLPNVREAPERAPDPSSDAARNAADVVSEQFIEQGLPVADRPPTGVTVGDGLRAAGGAEPEPDVPEPEQPSEPEPLDADALPPGYEFLDEEPPEDFEQPEEPTVEPEEEEFYVDDQETSEATLRAQLRKAEKQAAHERELRVRGEQKNWRAESERVFPFSKHKLGEIKATSRRDFLRQAREIHRETIGVMQTYGSVKAPEVVAAELEQIEADHRAAVAAGYGKPTAGPDSAVVSSAETEQTIADSRAAFQRGEIDLGKHMSNLAKSGR